MAVGDGNIGSLVQMVIDDLHLPGISDTVRRFCLQAMRFHRDRRYYFSDRECRFNLTPGREAYKPGDGYGLPADVVEIASKTIWILVNGSIDQRWPCNRVDSINLEWSRATWGSNRSQPQEWDWHLDSLRFSPPSQVATDVAEFRYLTDLGIPRVTYENGQYRYYHPTTNAELTTAQLDNWSNDWLTQEKGGEAIRTRTMYMVQKQYIKDSDGANETLATWLELIGQMENETESKTAGLSELPGTILGDMGW